MCRLFVCRETVFHCFQLLNLFWNISDSALEITIAVCLFVFLFFHKIMILDNCLQLYNEIEIPSPSLIYIAATFKK